MVIIPYGLTEAAYQAEVKRKRAAGIPLTQPYVAPKTTTAPRTTTATAPKGYVPIRSTLSGAGYDVGYSPGTRNINVSGQGRTGTIAPSAYRNVGGTAYIDPSYIKSWLNKTATPSGASPYPQGAADTSLGGRGQQDQGMGQYGFPYEQMLRDLMAQPSAYNMPSEDELLRQAGQYADLEINPYLSALDTRWGQEEAGAQTARGDIEAAYAGLGERTKQMLDEARRAALESAISRGAGRSGVVDWRTAQVEKPIYAQQQQQEAEKAARLASIANMLAASQSDIGRQRGAYEQRRGMLQSNQLAALRQQAQQQALAEQARKWSQGMGLAGMGLGANQFQQQGMMDLLNPLLYG